ncbi:hypothetical protein [Salinibacterium sp. PAMC 21357]|uniref:hypothetical protein n=1 Tax=Salinibacterium sp. PAMC 21357 TaxID=1112215 RepID=UPI000289E1FA|nr:hypothetical protein [Salinibacterium sp. PAMC 21357]
MWWVSVPEVQSFLSLTSRTQGDVEHEKTREWDNSERVALRGADDDPALDQHRILSDADSSAQNVHDANT